MRRLVVALLAGLAAASALAVQPDEMLADPALEARAREISRDLRCLVCQNQSIDDSDAPLAHDLRVLLRERLKAGDTNEQAKQYLVDRYGDYVLLKPPFKKTTLVLWLGPPLLLLLAGAAAAFAVYRQRRLKPAADALSAEEKARLARLLKDDSAP
jgi:cytochrome c-type biogenesis protein CcmH